ncbi:LacI family DNA-binding transcriptional regulator [Mariniphaga sp.]|uniref:LacI family DNA-binding transcriptional regulator n=1 Tax=Mariniphaga sp. TaxID=1954475 RepID=UPI00356AB9DC
MEKKVNNIKELAEKLGLSPTTVSRVLNGKSKNFRISQETSRKVLDAARKYHYSPNRIARGLKLEKTETIGLIIPDIANPYFGSIAKTIEMEAHKKGYSIILCDSLDDEVTEAELLQLLAGRKVDGIIIAPTGKSSRHVTEVQNQGIPVMVIDRYLVGTELPFITTDNYIGALLATEHVIEMGHRNIACIQGINGISANTDRVKGYHDALQKHGIRVNELLILGTDFGEENGYIQTRKLLELPSRPTAIFALSNLISLGILRALKEAGLTVPDDISIVSFDEQPYSAFLACPMTTVEQPREEIGRLAFDFLLIMIDEGASKKVDNLMLQPRLIFRESVKKISI